MMSDKDEVFVIGQKYLWKDSRYLWKDSIFHYEPDPTPGHLWEAPNDYGSSVSVLEVSVVAQYFGKSDDDDDGITELGKDCTVLVRNESNADLLYWVQPSDLVASAEQRRGAQLKPGDFADSEDDDGDLTPEEMDREMDRQFYGI